MWSDYYRVLVRLEPLSGEDSLLQVDWLLCDWRVLSFELFISLEILLGLSSLQRSSARGLQENKELLGLHLTHVLPFYSFSYLVL